MENWRPIEGYEGRYEVSDLGRVKSLARDVPHWRGGMRHYNEKVLKPVQQAKKYYVVSLYDSEARMKISRIHLLVLEAFVGPRPEDAQACHRDDDKSNNALSNLYWGTTKQNTLDAKRNGKRAVRSEDTCKNGHPWTEESKYVHPETDVWACRICQRGSEARGSRAVEKAAKAVDSQ